MGTTTRTTRRYEDPHFWTGVHSCCRRRQLCVANESGSIRGKCGPSAAAGAPGSTKKTDMGNPRNKVAAGSVPGASAACTERRDAEVDLWADNLASAAWNKMAAHRRRKRKKAATAVHSAKTESAFMAAVKDEFFALLLDS